MRVTEAGGVCLACGRTEIGVSPGPRPQRQSSAPPPPPSCWRGVDCCSTTEAVPGRYLGLYSKIFRLGRERQQVRRDRKQRWRGKEVSKVEELWGH